MNKVLCIDDDRDILELLSFTLSGAGFQVTTLSDPTDAVACAVRVKPDLILLDIMMPALSGYDVCAALRRQPETSELPIIFLTALNQYSDKMKALSLGAVDFVSKPFKGAQLIPLINGHIAKNLHWATPPAPQQPRAVNTGSITTFRQALLAPGGPGEINPEAVKKMSHADVYAVLGQLNFSRSEAAKTIAGFLNLPFIPIINPDNIKLGVLPAKFMRGRNIVALAEDEKGLLVALSNPFDFELVDLLGRMIQEPYSLAVADPDSISNLYHLTQDPGGGDEDGQGLSVETEEVSTLTEKKTLGEQVEESPVKYITSKLIEAAIQERASDIHMEPKELFTSIRFRIDGDLKEFTRLKTTTAVMAVTRLKVLAGMDITERRRPQDGAFVAALGERRFTLRLATTSTNYGESMVIRLIEPQAKPKTLRELGMDKAQSETMLLLSSKTQGMLILAGPSGAALYP